MSAMHGIAGWGLAFAPMLPLWAVAAFAAAAVLLLALGAWRGARGLWWRAAGLALLLLILLDPSLVRERREAQRDVAIVIVDDLPSMDIGNRRAAGGVGAGASAAATEERSRSRRAGDSCRRAQSRPTARRPGHASSITRLTGALADLPRQRFAGAIMITDGEVHDMPPPLRLGFDAPLHALITGKPGEADRRLVIEDAPSFGLVGKSGDA